VNSRYTERFSHLSLIRLFRRHERL
jgi:hypothetical protein